jgi:hypothetical protein
MNSISDPEFVFGSLHPDARDGNTTFAVAGVALSLIAIV